MSVVNRLTGPMPSGTYVAKLQSAIAAHAEQLATVRAARSAQNFERNLREEQDSAYERSLARDRERAQRKKMEQAAAEESSRKEKQAAEAAQTLAQKRRHWRQWRAKSIAPEPGTENKDVVRIALKMPEAARIMRRFPADAGIEELYAFVECYDLLNEKSFPDTEKPSGYEHKFDFRLVSTLPRVVYDVGQGGTIGERVGKSGNLIVEPIGEDDGRDS